MSDHEETRARKPKSDSSYPHEQPFNLASFHRSDKRGWWLKKEEDEKEDKQKSL